MILTRGGGHVGSARARRARRPPPRATSLPACVLTPPRASSPTTPRTTSRRQRRCQTNKPCLDRRSPSWSCREASVCTRKRSGSKQASSRERAAPGLVWPPACSGVRPHSTPAPAVPTEPPPRPPVRGRTPVSGPGRQPATRDETHPAPIHPDREGRESPLIPFAEHGRRDGAGRKPYPTGRHDRARG